MLCLDPGPINWLINCVMFPGTYCNTHYKEKSLLVFCAFKYSTTLITTYMVTYRFSCSCILNVSTAISNWVVVKSIIQIDCLPLYSLANFYRIFMINSELKEEYCRSKKRLLFVSVSKYWSTRTWSFSKMSLFSIATYRV